MTNSGVTEAPSSPVLRRLTRLSAWLLIAGIAVLVISGWGITHTEIVYKASFGLIDRRLANSIHRATNLPLVIFFLSHVLINIRLAIHHRNARRGWLIDGTLIAVGLGLIALFLFVEYLA